jgi:hypothetical protein
MVYIAMPAVTKRIKSNRKPASKQQPGPFKEHLYKTCLLAQLTNKEIFS